MHTRQALALLNLTLVQSMGCVCALVALAFLLALHRRRRPALLWDPMVVVINLENNRQRLAAFMQRYMASDLASVRVHRVDAVDGREGDWSSYLSPEALEQLMSVQKTGFRTSHPDLTPGAVGCYLSHMQAWGHVAASGKPFGLVFEDDAAIPPDVLDHFTTAAPPSPNWDIVLLGYEGDGQAAGPGLLKMSRFLRLHAYAITAEAASRLCASALPIRQQVDWEVSAHIAKGLRVFGLSPSRVKVAWQGTNIQTPLKPGA